MAGSRLAAPSRPRAYAMVGAGIDPVKSRAVATARARHGCRGETPSRGPPSRRQIRNRAAHHDPPRPPVARLGRARAAGPGHARRRARSGCATRRRSSGGRPSRAAADCPPRAARRGWRARARPGWATSTADARCPTAERRVELPRVGRTQRRCRQARRFDDETLALERQAQLLEHVGLVVGDQHARGSRDTGNAGSGRGTRRKASLRSKPAALMG